MKKILEKFCLLATKLAAASADVEALREGVEAFEELLAELQGSIYDMEAEAIELEILEEYHQLAESEKEEADNTEKVDYEKLEESTGNATSSSSSSNVSTKFGINSLKTFARELREPKTKYFHEMHLQNKLFVNTLKIARQEQQTDPLFAGTLVTFIERTTTFTDRLSSVKSLVDSKSLIERTLNQLDLEDSPFDEVKDDLMTVLEFFEEYIEEMNPTKSSRHLTKILNKRYEEYNSKK